jgi:hypothetical protein
MATRKQQLGGIDNRGRETCSFQACQEFERMREQTPDTLAAYLEVNDARQGTHSMQCSDPAVVLEFKLLTDGVLAVRVEGWSLTLGDGSGGLARDGVWLEHEGGDSFGNHETVANRALSDDLPWLCGAATGELELSTVWGIAHWQ